MNATRTIAACARQKSDAGHFGVKLCAGIGKLESTLKRRCARIHAGATMHHGFDSPERSATAAPTQQDSGFLIFHPVLRGAHGFLFGGPCGGIRKNAPVLRPVCQPHTVCHPHLTVRGQFLNCHVGASMADIRNTPTPDTIAGLQAATGRANRALTLLKNARTGTKIGGAA